MLVATWSGSLLRWEEELTVFKSRLSSAFGRAELRRSASVFIDGLLSGVARKTGWQLAEQVSSVSLFDGPLITDFDGLPTSASRLF